MKKTSSVARVPRPHFCFALLALVCSSAWAGYSVIDEDLLPTAMVEARYNERTQGLQDRYAIPFTKDRSALNDADRAILDMLLPRMTGGAAIRIVGRPDSMYFGGDKAEVLARNRAINIRDYLVHKGISNATIKYTVDTTPNTQPNGNNYPSDLYIGASAQQNARATYLSAQREPIEEYIPSRPSHTAQPREMGASNDAALYLIDQMVESGQLKPSSALRLIQVLMASRTSALAETLPIEPRPTFSPPVTAIPVKYVERPGLTPAPSGDKWTLDKSRTLQQNLAVWARRARLDIEWDIDPKIAPNIRETTDIRAASFADAVTVVLRGLQSTGYLGIKAAIYSDVVRFTQSN